MTTSETAATIRAEVEELLADLGEVTSPEETLEYVEHVAERMRAELEEVEQ